MKKDITLEQIYNFFKICKEFKFEIMAYFMIGFFNETKEYRANFLKEIKKLDPDYFLCNLLCPYAKTEYYETLLKNGILYPRDHRQGDDCDGQKACQQRPPW